MAPQQSEPATPVSDDDYRNYVQYEMATPDSLMIHPDAAVSRDSDGAWVQTWTRVDKWKVVDN